MKPADFINDKTFNKTINELKNNGLLEELYEKYGIETRLVFCVMGNDKLIEKFEELLSTYNKTLGE